MDVRLIDPLLASSRVDPLTSKCFRAVDGALSESTGRNDVVTLTARGTALLSLGRAWEAVDVLRQAQTLAPGVSEIKAQLATAERLARAETRVSAVATPSAPIETARATTPSPRSHPARTYSNAAEPTRSH